jgi:membrane peptidoglycan carboxypeptidase
VIASLRRLARDRQRLRIALLRHEASSELDTQFVSFVLAAEDKRYWTHAGVDWIAVCRALLRTAIGKPKGGASTIEMQFVRTVTHRRERSARRKIREIWLALGIGEFAPKSRILSTYLDRAYFGYEHVGVEATSTSIFHARSAELCIGRKALLAALLVRPIPRHRTRRWYLLAFRRARWILRRSNQLGPITAP